MIKVSVIGAGSSYTPELIEGFVESWSDLPVSQVTLMDIDERRLDVVAGLARRMVETAGVDIRIEQTLQRREAIEGSRFVVSQIRVGGVDARLLDETIPPRFGVIGQETTGPGGFAKALRTIPVVLGIASDVEVSAPGAVLVNFTNPAGLIAEALQRHSAVQAIGLCNLPIGMEMRVAEQLGVERGRVRLDWVGLNHLNWTRGVTIDGRDVWPEVFAGAIELARKSVEDGWTFSAELLETLGMIPCGYLN
jgi:6-phospho-beta-glucosidase